MWYRTLAAAAFLGAISAGATAQDTRSVQLELRPFMGAYLPRGVMGREFKAAPMFGMQSALELSRYSHLVGSIGFTHGRAKYAGFGDDLTYIWQYDVGAEFNALRALDGGWLLRPFAGLGAGGRTYDYTASGVSSRSCTAGYGALGSEVQNEALALRLEGRGYLSCFESPVTGRHETRNDFALTFGVAFHLW